MEDAVQSEDMSRREQVVFVLGDIFGGGASTVLSVLYFFFLTDMTGLAPALAGLVVGLAKVTDAVAKPLLGRWSDGLRTPWGRRRPALFLGAIAVVGAIALLWWPVTGAGTSHFVWALSTAIFYTVAAAVVSVNYASLSTEVTTHVATRNRINLIRVAVSQVAAATMTVVATAAEQAHRSGQLSSMGVWWVLVGIAAVAFLPTLLAVAMVCRERAPMPAVTHLRPVSAFAHCWRLPAFRALLGLYLAQGLTLDVVGSLVLAYTRHVVPMSAVVFFAIMIAVNLVGFAITTTLVRTRDKAAIYGTLLPLAILAGLGLALWPTGFAPWALYVLAVVLAVGLAGATLMVWVMFPDVVDAYEVRTGERMAGTMIGSLVFARSCASGVLMWIIGVVLQLSGYVGSAPSGMQPSTAQWAIRLVIAVSVAAFLGAGWFLARRYPLTREAVEANHMTLAETRRREETP